MVTPENDQRSPERQIRDEQIASEPRMAPLSSPPDAPTVAVETLLQEPVHRPFRRCVLRRDR